MTPQENRDDLIKRVLDQKRTTKRGELSAKEVKQVEAYIKKTVMPQVYDDKK